jgi:hypothetical protein
VEMIHRCGGTLGFIILLIAAPRSARVTSAA